jgi:hypothetical protein
VCRRRYDTDRPDFASSSCALGPGESVETVRRDLAQCRRAADEQDQFLCREVQPGGPVESAQHTIMFTHIPPFIRHPLDRKGYFNYAPEVRQPLLRRLKAAGVSKWFCGHYHRTAGGWDGELEVVVTSAAGLHLLPHPEGHRASCCCPPPSLVRLHALVHCASPWCRKIVLEITDGIGGRLGSQRLDNTRADIGVALRRAHRGGRRGAHFPPMVCDG